MTAPAGGTAAAGGRVHEGPGSDVHAVAAARGLAPEDLDVRLRADASSRTVVLTLLAVAIGWRRHRLPRR